jgi:PAS domain S-box-containing protein
MLSLSALFFGPLTAAVAASMAFACRVWQGGSGMWMGLPVIVSTTAIGLLLRWRLRGATTSLSVLHLFLFGFVVHVVVLSLMALLPQDVRMSAVLRIGPIILGVFPFTTVLAGRILADQESRRTLLAGLERSQEQWESLGRNIPGVVYRCDAQPPSRVRVVSQGVLNLLGRSADDFISGRVSWLDVIVPEDRAAVSRAVAAAVAGGESFECEYRVRHADGAIRWIHERGQAILGPDGRPQWLDGVVMDVTDRQEMERRLLHTQKLESLGVLAGGIAHDFNNLLTVILGNLELSLGEPRDAARRDALGQALDASRRAADLTRQMLAYSGRGQFILTRFDLSQAVRGNAELLRTSVAKNVRLELRLTEDLPPVEADTGQVQQVIMNLITNANEAIGHASGTVTLTTSAVECSAEYLSASRVSEKPAPGRFVCLEVRDTGAGMDQETKQRMFEPFFTTKFVGRGLGLSALLGIMRGHGGAILVDSEVGEGTVVRALFPAVRPDGTLPANGDAAAEAEESPSPLRRSGAILVVDDEPQVRRMAAAMIARLGFESIVAEDGRAALTVLDERPDAVCCVLLDLTMPGMDGVTTFGEIRRRLAELPVILCSGYSEAEATNRFTGAGLAGFLQKPYGLDDLRARLGPLRGKGTPAGATGGGE